MNEEIKAEQKELAEQLSNLSDDVFEKKSMALLSYLQGFEVGYQSAMKERENKDD